MTPSMQSARKLGMNKIHHQTGALPSQSAAIWFEIQPKLRLLATSGTRCNSAGTCGTFAGIVLALIAPLPSFLDEQWKSPSAQTLLLAAGCPISLRNPPG